MYFDIPNFMVLWKQSQELVYSDFITGMIDKSFEKIDKLMLMQSVLTYKRYHL